MWIVASIVSSPQWLVSSLLLNLFKGKAIVFWSTRYVGHAWWVEYYQAVKLRAMDLCDNTCVIWCLSSEQRLNFMITFIIAFISSKGELQLYDPQDLFDLLCGFMKIIMSKGEKYILLVGEIMYPPSVFITIIFILSKVMKDCSGSKDNIQADSKFEQK